MRINTEYNSHENNVGFGARILATDATRKAFEYANQLLYRNNKEDFLVVDKFCKGMDKALNYHLTNMDLLIMLEETVLVLACRLVLKSSPPTIN